MANQARERLGIPIPKPKAKVQAETTKVQEHRKAMASPAERWMSAGGVTPMAAQSFRKRGHAEDAKEEEEESAKWSRA